MSLTKVKCLPRDREGMKRGNREDEDISHGRSCSLNFMHSMFNDRLQSTLLCFRTLIIVLFSMLRGNISDLDLLVRQKKANVRSVR